MQTKCINQYTNILHRCGEFWVWRLATFLLKFQHLFWTIEFRSITLNCNSMIYTLAGTLRIESVSKTKVKNTLRNYNKICLILSCNCQKSYFNSFIPIPIKSGMSSFDIAGHLLYMAVIGEVRNNILNQIYGNLFLTFAWPVLILCQLCLLELEMDPGMTWGNSMTRFPHVNSTIFRYWWYRITSLRRSSLE